ncbi:uncharacterized protein H6S33_009440 [Morchella sextelata]|uniref:uncharacterized protein n=1 Tax=Morchella sextelata TaxID=1174677 RepID=UPI001D037B70|nr:uncharacterized protein H6S33_009440 [Morchella sextelata]KAH0613060.1 hypothetical protein H6S33_009440 [Morchella sextelata]
MWHNVNLPGEDTSHNEHLLPLSNSSNYGDYRHLLRNVDVGSLGYPLKFPESDAVCGDFRPRSGISLDLSTARIHPKCSYALHRSTVIRNRQGLVGNRSPPKSPVLQKIPAMSINYRAKYIFADTTDVEHNTCMIQYNGTVIDKARFQSEQ